MEQKLRDSIKNKFDQEEIIEVINKEDEMSDLEEDEISKMTQEEQIKNAITNDLKEKVVTYVKIDDEIRRKNEEIKKLKEDKKPCEEVIIKFLENCGEDLFNIGNTGEKIIKQKRDQKAPLKIDIIKEAIKEHLIKEQMVETEERVSYILNDIAELIDKKRPIKSKVTIRRSIPKPKKQKK